MNFETVSLATYRARSYDDLKEVFEFAKEFYNFFFEQRFMKFGDFYLKLSKLLKRKHKISLSNIGVTFDIFFNYVVVTSKCAEQPFLVVSPSYYTKNEFPQLSTNVCHVDIVYELSELPAEIKRIQSLEYAIESFETELEKLQITFQNKEAIIETLTISYKEELLQEITITTLKRDSKVIEKLLSSIVHSEDIKRLPKNRKGGVKHED